MPINAVKQKPIANMDFIRTCDVKLFQFTADIQKNYFSVKTYMINDIIFTIDRSRLLFLSFSSCLSV